MAKTHVIIEKFNCEDNKYDVTITTDVESDHYLKCFLDKLKENGANIEQKEKTTAVASFSVDDVVAKVLSSECWMGYAKDKAGYRQHYISIKPR